MRVAREDLDASSRIGRARFSDSFLRLRDVSPVRLRSTPRCADLQDFGDIIDAHVVYRILAVLVLLAHAAFVAFVVLGGLLALRWPRSAWIHVPAASWGAGIEFFGGFCPLTPLENHLRHLAGAQGYDAGFIEHYVVALLYPAGLTSGIQVLLGTIVVAANALIYALVVWRRHRGHPVHVRLQCRPAGAVHRDRGWWVRPVRGGRRELATRPQSPPAGRGRGDRGA